MLIFIFLGLFYQLNAQTSYPKGYFGNPLPLPMQLAANFGELRNNHFHMGLDIRTAQRENIPVLSAASGFISRIKVERGGYGRAIYVQHPNGYTTLYAHLNLYYPALENALRNEQYRTRQWAQDLSFPPEALPVTKGMQIGLSGNTGGSAGPHLHFEIRETSTDHCLNPLLFYTLVPDRLAPVIKGAYWFDRSRTTYAGSPAAFRAGTINLVPPVFSTGLHAEDKSSNSPYYFGIFKASVSLDGALVNSFTLNDFSYDSTRQMNGCVDYPRWVRKQNNIQHLSRLPGVHLDIFAGPAANGIIRLTDDKVHTLVIVAEDVNGNRTVRRFEVRRDAAAFSKNPALPVLAVPNRPFVWQQHGLLATFAANAFYDSVPFSSFPLTAAPAQLSWQLATDQIPVQSRYQVMLPMPAGGSEEDHWQVSVKSGGYTQYDMGIPLPGRKIAADSLNRLGILTVEKDNTPPSIRILTSSVLRAGSILRLRATDTQGELSFVKVLIDGQWHPFAHAKDDAWWILPDGFPAGIHTLTAVAADVAGNIREQQFSFSSR